MKFSELRRACNGANYDIEAYDKGGNVRREEIHLMYTVDAGRKLARYDDAEVLRIRPGVSTWEGEIIAVLEVELDV